MTRLLHVLLWLSIAVALFVTFVWPFVLPSGSAEEVLKAIGVGTFAAFFTSLIALICRALRTSS